MTRHHHNDSPLHMSPLSNAGWLAGKAALACALALLLCRWLQVPDLVTSTFVAVLCVSPTVLIGLRRSAAQFVGSLLGGVFGTLAMLAQLPLELGIPVAVGLSILAALRTGLPGGYPIAAFTALFVQAVPRGSPLATFGVRLEAVLIAGLAATAVNLLISALSYRSIFDKRLHRAQASTRALLASAACGGPQALTPGFTMLATLETELHQAAEELAWRGAQRTLARVEQVHDRVAALHHLLHVAQDISLTACLPHPEGCDASYAFLRWLPHQEGPPPQVPESLMASAQRATQLARQGLSPLPAC